MIAADVRRATSLYERATHAPILPGRCLRADGAFLTFRRVSLPLRAQRTCEASLSITRLEDEDDDVSRLELVVYGTDWEDAERRLVKACRQHNALDALDALRRSP